MSLLKSKNRFNAIKNLSSVLSALQMVSVVKLQRAKGKAGAIKDYLALPRQVLEGRVKPQALEKKVLLIITSNRGLCGAFNRQVVNKAIEFSKDYPEMRFEVFGRKGVELLRLNPFYSGRTILSEYESIDRIEFKRVRAILQRILNLKAEVYVAYNSAQSLMVQVPKIYKLFPVPQEISVDREPLDFILEPNSEELGAELFRHYLEMRFYQILVDSEVGELSARLMILKGAVDNSKELIDQLKITVNKERQALITRELIEIVSSVEALRRDYE